MPIYSTNIKLIATAYVRANSEAEALKKVLAGYGPDLGAELPEGYGIDVIVSGQQLDNPDLPDLSISPAISFCGLADEVPVIDDEGIGD